MVIDTYVDICVRVCVYACVHVYIHAGFKALFKSNTDHSCSKVDITVCLCRNLSPSSQY